MPHFVEQVKSQSWEYEICNLKMHYFAEKSKLRGWEDKFKVIDLILVNIEEIYISDNAIQEPQARNLCLEKGESSEVKLETLNMKKQCFSRASS